MVLEGILHGIIRVLPICLLALNYQAKQLQDGVLQVLERLDLFGIGNLYHYETKINY